MIAKLQQFSPLNFMIQNNKQVYLTMQTRVKDRSGSTGAQTSLLAISAIARTNRCHQSCRKFNVGYAAFNDRLNAGMLKLQSLQSHFILAAYIKLKVLQLRCREGQQNFTFDIRIFFTGKRNLQSPFIFRSR